MKEKLYQFMQGRYGIDQLNNFLMIISIGCFIVNIFIGSLIINILAYVIWLIVIFRMLSKNIYVRNQENEKYLNFFNPLNRYLKLKSMNKQEPTHKHYMCPKCKQMVRIPKGHGKIVITCPSCKNKFEKRS
ncbi:hypothetical protein [Thomasclavelia sp.]